MKREQEHGHVNVTWSWIMVVVVEVLQQSRSSERGKSSREHSPFLRIFCLICSIFNAPRRMDGKQTVIVHWSMVCILPVHQKMKARRNVSCMPWRHLPSMSSSINKTCILAAIIPQRSEQLAKGRREIKGLLCYVRLVVSMYPTICIALVDKGLHCAALHGTVPREWITVRAGWSDEQWIK